MDQVVKLLDLDKSGVMEVMKKNSKELLQNGLTIQNLFEISTKFNISIVELCRLLM